MSRKARSPQYTDLALRAPKQSALPLQAPDQLTLHRTRKPAKEQHAAPVSSSSAPDLGREPLVPAGVALALAKTAKMSYLLSEMAPRTPPFPTH